MLTTSASERFATIYCTMLKSRRTYFCLAALILSLATSTYYFDRKVTSSVFSLHTKHSNLRPDVPSPASQLIPATGQHLMLDMMGGSFDTLNDEDFLRQATLNIVKETGMHLLGIQSSKLEPQGVSVVALLAESHLSIHTWPEHGSALIDLFTCGEGFNLQEQVAFVVGQYGGNVKASTYSVMPRGMAATPAHVDLEAQFQPAEIMTVHKYKHKVFGEQSPYQKVEVWDHHDTQEDDFSSNTMRSLFLDGVMQSNNDDEDKYHESLVHPAFIGSSVPAKRVLIVGGGEGGTLRESLKWKSVEKVVMVELDGAVIEASRKYLPSYSNCTGYGTDSCFDDPRLELYTEDFIKWFDDHIGNDICEKTDKKKDHLFDVIILDLLDTEALPEGEEWAEHLYSDLFFQRISCALNRFGVVVTNFGEAPEGPFKIEEKVQPHEQARIELFRRKIKQIQTMSKFFYHTRVYDTSIPSYRANWAFAIGMVPKYDGDLENKKFIKDLVTFGNTGINTFEGKPAKVNLKLNRGLYPVPPLAYYDGSVQHGFQYPTGDWYGAYCMLPENHRICDLPSLFMTALDDDELFDLRVTKSGEGPGSGLYAKRDIKKGVVTGMYDAATSLEIPFSEYRRLRAFGDKHNSVLNNMYTTWDFFAFGGGMSGLGETVYMSTSALVFANHACDHKPNIQSITQALPYTKELFETWHPVADRFRTELHHFMVTTRDIKKGEMITDDYASFESFTERDESTNWEHGDLPGVRKWCGERTA